MPERKNESLTRLIGALRRNDDGGGGMVNYEFMYRGQKARYIDPLIEEQHSNVMDPYSRERVAAEDPIANVLTKGFADRAWSEYPKFYINDQIDAEEIGLMTRQLLEQMKFHNLANMVMYYCAIHGWCVIRVWFEDQQFNWRIYSEFQVRPEYLIRDEQNRIIGCRVYTRPRLPLNRNQVNISPMMDELVVGMPGVFFVCRGDKVSSFGFGYSRLEPIWDSLVKLREESHADAFRSRIFPISTVPADWTDDQIDAYFENIAKMDSNRALVTRSGVDGDGKLRPELPAINWVTPGQSASQKSANGSSYGGGGFAQLSSEWVRLCAATRHSIRYFTGNPGGALAAADVDSQQDLQSDIEEFNLYRDFVTEFLTFLQQIGVQLDLPLAYVIKSHWEWERDEQMLAEAEMQMYELQAKAQPNDSRQNRYWIENAGNPDPSKGRGFHMAYSRAPMALKRGRQLQQQQMSMLGQDPEMQGLLGMPVNDPTTGQPSSEIIPGQWINITGSESGRWKRVKLGLDSKTVVAETSEGRQYHYDDIPQAEQYVGAIRDQGGHAIWELLRAPQAVRDLYPKGQSPMGFAKTGTGFYPYAGAAHYQPEYDLGDPDSGQPVQSEQPAPEEAALAQINPADIQGQSQSFTEMATQTPLQTQMLQEVPTFSSIAQKSSPFPQAQPLEGAPGMSSATIAKATKMRDAASVRAEENKQRDTERATAMKERDARAAQRQAEQAQAGTVSPTQFLGDVLTRSRHVSLRLLGRVMRTIGRQNDSLSDLSRKNFNEAAQQIVNHSFGNQQIDYIKTLIKYDKEPTQNVSRMNAVAYGNGMAFDQPLYYPNGNGGFTEEYACKKDWKKLVGQKGPLDLFHMNQRYTVGTYEVVGWDDASDLPIDRIHYDEDKVKNACTELGLEYSRVIQKLNMGLVPDISTEYFCDIKVHNNKRFQVNFRNISASFVDFGNCPDNKCVFTKSEELN